MSRYPKNEIVFPVGTRVRVLSDYHDSEYSPHRAEIAVVIDHVAGDCRIDTPFIDNILKFESGNEEPFGNWEIEPVEETKQ